MSKLFTLLSTASAAALGILYFSKRKEYNELKADVNEKQLKHLDLRSNLLYLSERLKHDKIDSEEVIAEIHGMLDDDIKYF